MFAIFKKRDFSLMWLAQLISTIGESLTDLAAAILIFQITNSAFAVGAVLMVTAIPTLFVGLFAGVFVDRFDKKRILLLANLLRGFIVLGIPLAYITFMPSNQDLFVFSLYGLIFISATVRQFFDPAWESVLPEIATEEELTQANSFLAMSSFGSTAVGFAAAGFLASSVDPLLRVLCRRRDVLRRLRAPAADHRQNGARPMMSRRRSGSSSRTSRAAPPTCGERRSSARSS